MKEQAIQTSTSQCPIVLKHDFPNESQNYIDEKMEEGQYKKRFRYDRPVQQTKLTPQGKGKLQLVNMNSGDLYQKLLYSKTDSKPDRFVIKPQKKLNSNSLHAALYKVKRQQELLNAKIKEAEKGKQYFKENDICMLANTGAIDFILSQNMELDKIQQQQPEEAKKIRRVKSAAVKPKYDIVNIPDDPIDFLEVEGKAFNLAYSQLVSQQKLRPASSYSTLRPLSSTKNWSDKIFTHEKQNTDHYPGIRNLLVERVNEEQEGSQGEIDNQNIGLNTFMNPSPSESYYPAKGVRGCKVGTAFMHKGLQRTYSAAVQRKQEKRENSPKQRMKQGFIPSRPQSAYQYFGNTKKYLSNVKEMDHMRVIEEIKRQDDVFSLANKNNELTQKIKDEKAKLAVQGSHVATKSLSNKDLFYVNYTNYIAKPTNSQMELKVGQLLHPEEFIMEHSLPPKSASSLKRPMSSAVFKYKPQQPRINSSQPKLNFVNFEIAELNQNFAKPIHKDQYQKI